MPGVPRGWWVIDKPVGLSSRAAVDRAARWLPRRTPLGHTGTLDPLAGGVLVLAVGAATRLTEYVQQLDKVYEAEVTLGCRSATDDAEGPITPVTDQIPDRPTVEAALSRFLGVIEQVPPNYSAVHVDGRRAYDLARSGRPEVPVAKKVRIDELTITAFAPPRFALTLRCGKGTYVRAVARDLGELLGCGGYLSRLRRTRVGRFAVENAVPLETDRDDALAQLLPLETPLDFPRLNLTSEALGRVRQGQFIPGDAAGTVALFDGDGQLAALGQGCGIGLIRPVKVFLP